MDYKAFAYIHGPVLIGASEDLNQVPKFWFLIILGLEQNMFDFTRECLETTAELST